MKIKIIFTGAPNDDGARFSFEHTAEVRDEGEAIEIGREFARLGTNLMTGCNEGFTVAIPDTEDRGE